MQYRGGGRTGSSSGSLQIAQRANAVKGEGISFFHSSRRRSLVYRDGLPAAEASAY